LIHVSAVTVTSVRPGDADPAARFEKLALPLFDSVYRFALRLTRSEADAQDLVQEAYLKAFRSFHTFRPDTNFRAWIFRILKNTYLSSLSNLHRLQPQDERDLPTTKFLPITLILLCNSSVGPSMM
jgi:RNA polymerase sigma-70 factor (ECF subfamily)